MKKISLLIKIALLLIILFFTFAVIYTRQKDSVEVISVKTPYMTVDLGNGIKMEFVAIKDGNFMMGSLEEEGEEDETPRHNVSISKPFYIGEYEVTQAQWKEIMGYNPSHFLGDDLPVDTVSWDECQMFVEKLSNLTGYQVTLPTEAQWEYACRAGTTTHWFYGKSDENAGDYGWIDINSNGTTHPVGTKLPNPWGIYDMYGNIQEWCLDWYAEPYPNEEVIDPSGPDLGDSRVIRGGAWGDNSYYVRSGYRNANGVDGKTDGIGFRCVLMVE